MVLNPDLFRRLRSHFGDVRVVNPGEAVVFDDGRRGGIFEARPLFGYSGPRLKRPRVVHAGEQYAVNCPRCGDTKTRLVIHHCFPHVPLAKCHNEDCYANRAQRDQLAFVLFRTRKPPAPRLNRGYSNPDAGKRPPIPAGFQFLGELPADHEARAYLEERGFDPVEISETYGVGYCGDDPNPNVRGRIIVPLVMGNVVLGWQARFIGERYWKATDVPKYYTAPGTRKNQVLYGLDRAVDQPFAVLVEGVTDVWAVGPCAVGLLGKAISFAQRRLIAFALRNHVIAVMLDADARKENHAVVQELRREHRPGVVMVDLPDGMDPGSLATETNLAIIAEAARAQGFETGVQ